MKMTLSIVSVSVWMTVLGPAPGWALNFFELETYPATTEGAGLHEFESLTTFVGNGRSHRYDGDDEARRHRLVRTSLEYNYGLTDKIDAAMYLDFERANGQDAEYAGSRYRFRGALFDQGRFPVDFGWYVEAEVPHRGAAQLEFEFRPLLSANLGKFTVDVNPAFELPTIADERRTLEFNYAARVVYRASRRFMPGIEFYGGIGQIRDVEASKAQEHYILPVVYARIFDGLKLAVGPGFGLTRGSDKVILKAHVEWEFTIGGRGNPAPSSVAPY